MVSLSDLPFESPSLVPPSGIRGAKVALISTAGIHRSSDARFQDGETDYRIIPGDVDAADLVMSHRSINFDRSGFQQDVNVIFPLEHLRKLANLGEVGSVATWHYSFMGAADPIRLQKSGSQVGRLLREDGVSAVLLFPV